MSEARPAVGGLHLREWACELVGTALLLGIGFSAVALAASERSPVARALGGPGPRFLVIGVAFGLVVAAIAVSPLGRCSGAHLNPVVTLAFWARGDAHRHDLAGYALAQVAGAFLGTGLFALAWGPWAGEIGYARTSPAPVGVGWGLVIEAGLTLALVACVLACLAVERLAPLTPAIVAVVLAALIWVGSPPTGASLNPARSLAPAAIAGDYSALWIYVVGPLAGALAATRIVRAPTFTAKLCHDGRYRSTMRSSLPTPDATP